jgi:hypothetical protein
MVASDTVGGSVTLRLNNVPWDQALDVILRAKGLDKRRDGNVTWIAPQKELADYEQSISDARFKSEDTAPLSPLCSDQLWQGAGHCQAADDWKHAEYQVAVAGPVRRPSIVGSSRRAAA